VILQTGSRGGIVALAVVLLMMLFTPAGGIGARHKILLVALLAAAWLFMRDTIDLERYLTLLDLSSDYNVTGEEGRFNVWQSAIDLALANPLTGVGVECFSFAWGITRQLAGDPNIQWKSVHNSFLQIAVEVGLVGFGVYLLINLHSLAAFLRASGLRVQGRSNDARQLGALGGLMLLGFAGLVVSGFFLSQGYSIFCTLYFALAAAVAGIQGAMRSAPAAVVAADARAEGASG
jgi:O-antigen ligase